MDRLKHVIELTKSYHQYMPALLSLFVGLFSIKKASFLYVDEGSFGDNIPVTLMESVRR